MTSLMPLCIRCGRPVLNSRQSSAFLRVVKPVPSLIEWRWMNKGSPPRASTRCVLIQTNARPECLIFWRFHAGQMRSQNRGPSIGDVIHMKMLHPSGWQRSAIGSAAISASVIRG